MPSSTSDTADGAPPTIKRLRLSRACDRCRKRKVKCDEGHPCQACQLAHTACTFVEEAPAPKPRKNQNEKNVAELEARMGALERVLGAIPPSIAQAALSKLDTALSDTDTDTITHDTHDKHDKHDSLADQLAALSLSPSYLYLDHQGNPAWAGPTSGLPLIDMLNSRERGSDSSEGEIEQRQRDQRDQRDQRNQEHHHHQPHHLQDCLPGRKPKHTGIEPVLVWTQVSSHIPIDLINTLIRTYMATTHLLWPFLHIPTFLQDYATPSAWGEPGFASLVVAICTIASRHIDDVRVRSDAADPASSGRSYLVLYERLREIQNAHGGTGSGNVYYIQSTFLIAIYLIGSGKLGRAFATLAKSITLSIDSGLHRSLEHYDLGTDMGVWMEVRKRTFWSVFCWDKQAAAAFGRPPMIRLRDCDLDEPLDVDDEHLASVLSGAQSTSTSTSTSTSRIRPFIHMIRLHVVLERVLDGVNTPPVFSSSPFLTKAASVGQNGALAAAEGLLEEWRRQLPSDLLYNDATIASNDAYRLTQAERIHCLEQLTRMLVYRHRFSAGAAGAAGAGKMEGQSQSQSHHYDNYAHAAQQAALTIIAAHSHISRRGLLTHYGVHVIHQLTQAGRTLVAVVLHSRRSASSAGSGSDGEGGSASGSKNRSSPNTHIAVSLEALRVAVGLLRQFAIRYGCGARSVDVLVEFCRVCHIPVHECDQEQEQEQSQSLASNSSGNAWLRPVPLKRDGREVRWDGKGEVREQYQAQEPSRQRKQEQELKQNQNQNQKRPWKPPKEEHYENTHGTNPPPFFPGLDMQWDPSAGSSNSLNFFPESSSTGALVNDFREMNDMNDMDDLRDLGTHPNLSHSHPKQPPPPPTNNTSSAADILNLLNTGRFDVDALLDGTSQPARALDTDDLEMLGVGDLIHPSHLIRNMEIEEEHALSQWSHTT
ncbi:hypothetical protein E3P86_03806 [Wallemia ichthyophaga]|uniref:Zn(2)-C6 fungal-type domain-containing protein n=1 Tax=Wallemia ichthyophaga TaxID=245174 RepID=A0A4T0IJ83_WALIC|nr:hypothetical protein E3P86_03806 [Wallemia ichthyophaga]